MSGLFCWHYPTRDWALKDGLGAELFETVLVMVYNLSTNLKEVGSAKA